MLHPARIRGFAACEPVFARMSADPGLQPPFAGGSGGRVLAETGFCPRTGAEFRAPKVIFAAARSAGDPRLPIGSARRRWSRRRRRNWRRDRTRRTRRSRAGGPVGCDLGLALLDDEVTAHAAASCCISRRMRCAVPEPTPTSRATLPRQTGPGRPLRRDVHLRPAKQAVTAARNPGTFLHRRKGARVPPPGSTATVDRTPSIAHP